MAAATGTAKAMGAAKAMGTATATTEHPAPQAVPIRFPPP
jgi:hypothetical protein